MKVPGRGFTPIRDLPVMVWLGTLVVVTLIHPWVPAPRWLMLHLLLLGAVSHAILVWSKHFTDTLLHAPTSAVEEGRHLHRLAAHNGGAVLVITGVLVDLWPVTLVGAAAVAAAAGGHARSQLRKLRTALPGRFSVTVHYYVAAACLLPVGAALGAAMAAGLSARWHERVLVAHVLVNLLGWVGLTVLGTLLTLWPTMLRTRMAVGAEEVTRRALPLLLGAILLAATGALLDRAPVLAVGLAAYLLGVVLLAGPLVAAARRKPPTTFAPLSVAAGTGWLVVVLALVTGGVAGGGEATAELEHWVPWLAAGFAAQVLLGASSYLVPVALRGGPRPVRAATAVLDRGSTLRLVSVNTGLVLLALPAPSVARVLTSLVVLVALAAYLPLLVLAIRASRRAKRGENVDPPAARPAGQLAGLASVGLAAVVLSVAGGVALDPVALTSAGATSATAGVPATGETTTVRVAAEDMRFSPATIEVPAGNRLVVELVNTDDEDVHDLVLDSGARSARLGPGETETVDVGVVGRDLEGWCSVLGHRQMGMVLEVDVTGVTTDAGAAGTTASEDHSEHAHGPGGEDGDDVQEPAGDSTHEHGDTSSPTLDLMADPGADFEPYDATLPPLGDGRVHRLTLRVEEQEVEVAPGVTQTMWTYNGSVPGPTLHGRVGDVFDVTLVNDGSIGHSIDFHAGALAPDRPMRTIEPGESLRYRFTATRAGIWMYHCSSMPMSAHIASGMYGAVVIEPPDLPDVDRSYVVVQSELYLGDQGSLVDLDKLAAEEPDAVVFNGHANQYAAEPLPARAGERVRVWVLAAGPNRGTSFHVVGGQFDTVYSEGSYLLGPGRTTGGAQSLALAPAQGGFVELTVPEPGTYPFVSHVMVDAERGARGLFEVR